MNNNERERERDRDRETFSVVMICGEAGREGHPSDSIVLSSAAEVYVF